MLCSSVCRRLALVFACLAGAWMPVAAMADNRHLTPRPPGKIALVIGNSDYSNLPDIPSAKIDAERVAQSLRTLGFDLHLHLNVADFREFEDTILPEFRAKIGAGDFVIVYFSGHGFTHGPHNMLAYTDQALTVKAARLAIDALSVEALEDLLVKREPGMLLFILDACRSIAGFVVEERDGRSTVPKGLNTPNSFNANAVNLMTAFATRPGAVAEGTAIGGEMSVFTNALVANLTDRNSEFGRLFNRVSTTVKIDTDETQQPGLHDYSDTDPYLDPTDDVIAWQREEWLSALAETDLHTAVRRFLRMNSVSHYAQAARNWLAANPNETISAGFTSVSPASVERAWMPSLAGENVSVARLEAPVAFERTLNAFISDQLKSIKRTDLGVYSDDLPDDVGKPDVLVSALENLGAHGTLIASQALVARNQPSFEAEPVAVRRQTKLTLASFDPDTQPRFNLTISATGEDVKTVWLQAELDNAEQVYLPINTDQVRRIRLGRALQEAIVPPRQGATRGLVDRDKLEEIIRDARRKYGSITWVSTATAPTDDPEQALVRRAQLSNTRLLLKQAGISTKRQTSVESAPDFIGDGVRIRIFGY